MKNRKFILNAESLTTGSHLSSSTSRFDHGDTRVDRRKLADGELNGDDQGTKMTPTPLCVDWWHNRDQLQRRMSMMTAMADMAARLCYTGDRSSVTMKQTTRVEPGAHPEHTGVAGRA